MGIKEVVEQNIAFNENTYRDSKSVKYRQIIHDYKDECELIEAYRGRELLELLQNADDELNEKLPKECLSYIARNYVYDSDLGNTCLTDINFESYAKALIMECEDKFLNKGPVRKLKDYFSKRKRRLEYE